MEATYKDYIDLYDSKPCKLLREFKTTYDFSEGKSIVYNKVIRYLNKEKLHKKYTENDFNELLKSEASYKIYRTRNTTK